MRLNHEAKSKSKTAAGNALRPPDRIADCIVGWSMTTVKELDSECQYNRQKKENTGGIAIASGLLLALLLNSVKRLRSKLAARFSCK